MMHSYILALILTILCGTPVNCLIHWDGIQVSRTATTEMYENFIYYFVILIWFYIDIYFNSICSIPSDVSYVDEWGKLLDRLNLMPDSLDYFPTVLNNPLSKGMAVSVFLIVDSGSTMNYITEDVATDLRLQSGGTCNVQYGNNA